MPTPFQQAVWDAVRQIPRGRVTTYGEIARHLGTGAVRAVGSAVAKNPHAPAVPCHRVVRSDGMAGQYSGGQGMATKIALLREEGIEVHNGRIVAFESAIWRYPSQSVTNPSGR